MRRLEEQVDSVSSEATNARWLNGFASIRTEIVEGEATRKQQRASFAKVANEPLTGH
jgi:hypothetical protein